MNYLTFYQNGVRQNIADRVIPNNNLNSAISDELRKDFHINDWHFIRAIEFADNTRYNKGNYVQRVNVFVQVPHFETGDQKVLNMEWIPIGEKKPTISRDDLVAAYRPYVAQGFENPYDINSAELTAMGDAYHEQQSQVWANLTPEEQVRAGVEEATIYFDAGFTDTDLLEIIADDWLISELSRADSMHRRDLANEVKAKIDEIQKRIKELKPDYEVTDWNKSHDDSWNPSRTASPGEFYADYAYWKGPNNSTIEEATTEYLKYHPDADTRELRTAMEKAAESYKETIE